MVGNLAGTGARPAEPAPIEPTPEPIELARELAGPLKPFVVRPVYRYLGVDRHGERAEGVTWCAPHTFVSSLYREGWHSVIVTTKSGSLVGYISTAAGRRVSWWSTGAGPTHGSGR
jgi:hypothetical protein